VASATRALPANTAIIFGAVLWSEAPSHQGHPERTMTISADRHSGRHELFNVLDAGNRT
jgi:hypothetical protein